MWCSDNSADPEPFCWRVQSDYRGQLKKAGGHWQGDVSAGHSWHGGPERVQRNERSWWWGWGWETITCTCWILRHASWYTCSLDTRATCIALTRVIINCCQRSKYASPEILHETRCWEQWVSPHRRCLHYPQHDKQCLHQDHHYTRRQKKNDMILKWKPSLQPPISRPNLYQIFKLKSNYIVFRKHQVPGLKMEFQFLPTINNAIGLVLLHSKLFHLLRT